MEYVTLSNGNIERSVSQIGHALEELGVDRKERLRLALMMENVFLDYQKQFGADTGYVLECDRKARHVRFTLRVSCPKFNPMIGGDETGITAALLNMQGSAPFWNYQGGENVILLRVRRPKKLSMIASLLLAVALAAVAGGLCTLLPDGTRTALSEGVIAPLFDAMMNVISCIAGPLIFLSVAWGIFSIGDVASIQNIGRRMFRNYFLFGFLLFAAGILAILPFFRIDAGGAGSISFSYFYGLILGIVPPNIVAPFLEGNTLQIIALALCFGLAALFLGKNTTVVSQFVGQINLIVQLIMDCISGMIPLFIFVSVFSNLLSGTFGDIVRIYTFLPAMLISCLTTMVISLAAVSLRFGVSPRILVRKLLATFVIALTTASSAAAFSTNVSTCTERLGISEKLSTFGVPLGQVIYCAGSCLEFAVIGLCVAGVSGVSVTPNWLVSLAVMSFVLGIATPPIPGGALASFTIFAAQLGIPAGSVSICLTLSIIADFIATAANLFNLQLDLVWLSGGLSMLDEDALRSKDN